jgi:hypothetical protein
VRLKRTPIAGFAVRCRFMHILLLVALSAASSKPALAVDAAVLGEKTPVGHRAFLEVLGSGLLYSVNYEITISDRAGVRLGVGGLVRSSATYIVGLGMPTVLIGRGEHKAVIAAGVGFGWIEDVALLESQKAFVAYGIGSVGYQFQPRPRGIFIRGCFTPVFAEQEFSP